MSEFPLHDLIVKVNQNDKTADDGMRWVRDDKIQKLASSDKYINQIDNDGLSPLGKALTLMDFARGNTGFDTFTSMAITELVKNGARFHGPDNAISILIEKLIASKENYSAQTGSEVAKYMSSSPLTDDVDCLGRDALHQILFQSPLFIFGFPIAWIEAFKKRNFSLDYEGNTLLHTILSPNSSFTNEISIDPKAGDVLSWLVNAMAATNMLIPNNSGVMAYELLADRISEGLGQNTPNTLSYLKQQFDMDEFIKAATHEIERRSLDVSTSQVTNKNRSTPRL